MLRVGLTGGIGSGKSTVAARLRERGAWVVDADAVAREVVEPGEPALGRIVSSFGPGVLTADGRLDRAALAAIVFPDPAALAVLESITTPAISTRSAALLDAAPAESVAVHDMALLVEKRLWPAHHLCVVVGADEGLRVRRLVEARGLGEADARARMAAQASDDERRAAADIWLDNSSTPGALAAAVDRLWDERLVPFDENLRGGIRSRLSEVLVLAEPDPTWVAQGARAVARIAYALSGLDVRVDHVGSTAVLGLVAKDVLDIQVGVPDLADADRPDFAARMRAAGYLLSEGTVADTPHPGTGNPQAWAKRFYGSTDPGRVAHVHVRETGSAGWEFAVTFRDWLRADDDERDAYGALKRRLLATGLATSDYASAKEPWFADTYPRVRAWRGRAGPGRGQPRAGF